VTEAGWLECRDPGPMLTALFGCPPDEDDAYPGTDPTIPGFASMRKLRLFGCACCRRVWDRLPSPDGRTAVELAERYADGAGGGITGWLRRQWLMDCLMGQAEAEAQSRVWRESSITWAPFCVLKSDPKPHLEASWYVRSRSGDGEAGAQVLLLRDLFGNPFRPVTLGRSWRTPTVASLAQAAYDERCLPSGNLDAARLAVLSDALEESGCNESEILTHLRSPRAHARGCWVLDLILGKS
jgi:hypothetical protein